jgi:hypothetical protein
MDIPLLWYSRLTGWRLARNEQVSNRSRRYVTTNGQSASQSWRQAPSGTQDQIFVTVAVLSMWSGLSNKRSGSVPLVPRYICLVSERREAPPPIALLLLRVNALPSNCSLVWWRKSVFTVPLPTWSCHILFLNYPLEVQALQRAVPTSNESDKILYRTYTANSIDRST